MKFKNAFPVCVLALLGFCFCLAQFTRRVTIFYNSDFRFKTEEFHQLSRINSDNVDMVEIRSLFGMTGLNFYDYIEFRHYQVISRDLARKYFYSLNLS